MRNLLFLFLPIAVLAAEYEFLTPYALVLKNSKPCANSEIRILKSGSWLKENALLRDRNGRISRKPDVTFYQYIKLQI